MVNASNYKLVGILGGTFNPIHYGHLRMAQELADHLNLDEVKFIPSANPPHKPTPEISAAQRAEMVNIAIADNPTFTLDKLELNRTGVSYTIDTLRKLHNEMHNVALCLMMGSDAFLKLDTWHQWQALIQYCHIILVQRPNNTNIEGLNPNLQNWMLEHYTEDLNDLTTKRTGMISMHKITALDISSSHIRQLIKNKHSAQYLSPNAVIDYIQQHQLYK